MAEDFFSDLSKSLTSAAQQAVDKTSTFFESQKMSVQIQAAQREIDKLYQKIGEAIFKESKDGVFAASEPVQALIDEVCGHNDKIMGLKKAIAHIRGQKICTECGAAIDGGHAFCPKCGAPAPEDEPEPDPVEEEVCECIPEAAEEAAEEAGDAAEELSEEVASAIEEAKAAVEAEKEAVEEAAEDVVEEIKEAAEEV